MKRGLSTIVSTLLILLLVFVAVGILWVVVRNVVMQGTEQVSLGKFTLDLAIDQVQLNNETNSILIKIKRNPGDGEFVGIKVIVFDEDNSEIFTINGSLKEYERKSYEFILELIDVDNIKKIQIAPVFRLESGKEVVGDVKDTWEKSESFSGSYIAENEWIPECYNSSECDEGYECVDYYCVLEGCESESSCALETCVGSVCSDLCGNNFSGQLQPNCPSLYYGEAPNGCGFCNCPSGYTASGSACVLDGSCTNGATQSCTILYGIGTQTCSSGEWEICTVVSCNFGYIISGNSCVPQQSGEEFLVYQRWDFENREVGIYTEEMVREDFDVRNTWMHGENSQIKNDVIHGTPTKVAASNFPIPPLGENCYDTPDEAGYRWSGIQIKAYLDTSVAEPRCRELYFTWNGKWTNHAVASLGAMKIPGLRGYPEVGFDDAGDMSKGFYATMLNQDHRIYAYHYDHTPQAQRAAMEENNVVSYPTLPWASHTYDGNYDFLIVPGTWYTFSQRLVLNSFTDGVPNYDGINEMWVDGHLIYQETELYLIGYEDRCIDGTTVSAFSNYCPSEVGEVRLDNVVTWVNVNDPTYGTRELHDIDEILETPIDP